MLMFGKDLTKEVVLVAEIGNNHEGSADKCFDLCYEALDAGADAVKLQVGGPRS